MSKLPHAPLVEVIFELRWNVTDADELAKHQYLHGDLFALLKDKFKYREALTLPDVPMEFYLNQPAYRFRVAENDYPLVQVGPGLLTVNTNDSKYDWVDFEKEITNVIQKFLTVYQFSETQNISLALQYFDFIAFDFERDDVFQFLTENLNVTVEQKFYKNESPPINLNLGFHFETAIGSLSVSIAKGKNLDKLEGIVLQMGQRSRSIRPDSELIANYLEQSHTICSQLFKKMTQGKLYDTFSN